MAKKTKSNLPIQKITTAEEEAKLLKHRQNAIRSAGWNSWIKAEGSNNPYEKGSEEFKIFAAGYKEASERYGSFRFIEQSRMKHAFTSEDVGNVIDGKDLPAEIIGQPLYDILQEEAEEYSTGSYQIVAVHKEREITEHKKRGRPPGVKNKVKK
jgi:hypothetical protein